MKLTRCFPAIIAIMVVVGLEQMSTIPSRAQYVPPVGPSGPVGPVIQAPPVQVPTGPDTSSEVNHLRQELKDLKDELQKARNRLGKQESVYNQLLGEKRGLQAELNKLRDEASRRETRDASERASKLADREKLAVLKKLNLAPPGTLTDAPAQPASRLSFRPRGHRALREVPLKSEPPAPSYVPMKWLGEAVGEHPQISFTSANIITVAAEATEWLKKGKLLTKAFPPGMVVNTVTVLGKGILGGLDGAEVYVTRKTEVYERALRYLKDDSQRFASLLRTLQEGGEPQAPKEMIEAARALLKPGTSGRRRFVLATFSGDSLRNQSLYSRDAIEGAVTAVIIEVASDFVGRKASTLATKNLARSLKKVKAAGKRAAAIEKLRWTAKTKREGYFYKMAQDVAEARYQELLQEFGHQVARRVGAHIVGAAATEKVLESGKKPLETSNPR